jgi:DNA-directed RNA polymerase subunit RPC12/RpoP
MKSKKEIMDGWIKVQKLSNDKSIFDIDCPVCGNKSLQYDDGYSIIDKLERNIYCNNCLSKVSVLMKGYSQD